MKTESKKKTEILDLQKLEPKNLPELAGWEEKQHEVVKENPFIECKDTESYEAGKKRRTSLRTARTSLEKQDKAIGSVLSQFRKKVKGETERLIEITREHEERQQEEVAKYEQGIEQRRKEKEEQERQEEEQKRAHIHKVGEELQSIIDSLTYETKKEKVAEFKITAEKYNGTLFGVWEVMLDSEIADKQELLDRQIEAVNLYEENRVQREIDHEKTRLLEIGKRASDIIFLTKPEDSSSIIPKIEKIFASVGVFKHLLTEFNDAKKDAIFRAENQVKKNKEELETKAKIAEYERMKEEQAEKERQEKLETRSKTLNDLGVKEGKESFSGHGIHVYKSQLAILSAERFDQLVSEVKDKISKQEAFKKRQTKLKSDKKKMTEAIGTLELPEIKLKNKESQELWNEKIKQRLQDYIVTIQDEIKYW